MSDVSPLRFYFIISMHIQTVILLVVSMGHSMLVGILWSFNVNVPQQELCRLRQCEKMNSNLVIYNLFIFIVMQNNDIV